MNNDFISFAIAIVIAMLSVFITYLKLDNECFYYPEKTLSTARKLIFSATILGIIIGLVISYILEYGVKCV